MGKGRFASSGVVVGQTPRSRRDQKTDQLKGNKVTMGKNTPRQTEGAVGDITVRDVTSIGLRCYIKTNSGWLDVNSLIATFRINWIDINLVNDWRSDTTFNFGTPQYGKDQNGFVHLRGAIEQDGGTVTQTMFTLPEGLRPLHEIWRFVPQVTRPVSITQLGVIKILSTGVVATTSAASTASSQALMVLEGISFFAHQKVTSIGAGSTVSQDQFPSGFPVL